MSNIAVERIGEQFTLYILMMLSFLTAWEIGTPTYMPMFFLIATYEKISKEIDYTTLVFGQRQRNTHYALGAFHKLRFHILEFFDHARP